MRVVGIDPATTHLSLALLEDGEVKRLLFENNRPKKGEKTGPERAITTAVLAWGRIGQDKTELSHWMDIDLIVIEGQSYHVQGKTAAGALITLATNAGAAGALFGCGFGAQQILVPSPREWKGQLKKHQHHPRICKALNWPFTSHETKTSRYTIPCPNASGWKFPHTSWYDLLDAIGLAQWGERKLTQERRRQRQ